MTGKPVARPVAAPHVSPPPSAATTETALTAPTASALVTAPTMTAELTEVVRPKIGIAFGGGGIRGMAHLAIIEGLEAAGIKADMVSGTSIGAGMGSLYAFGKIGPKYTRIALETDVKRMLAFGRKGGFIDGRKYAQSFIDVIGDVNVEDALIPLRIVATDLVKWQKHVFDHGSLMTAIQASSAIPGAFVPVPLGDMLLVDGCTIDNCPDDVVRELGADIVIAIDLDYRSYETPKNVVDVVQRALDIMISNVRQANDADVVIKPYDEYVGTLAASKSEYCYEQGRLAIEEKMPLIKAVIMRWYMDRNLDYRRDYPLW